MWITKDYEEGHSATFWIDIPDTIENRKRIESKLINQGLVKK